ncbi:hypothetical protein KUC_0710 [Vreelandella boliviensis LC1]|uniref:Uncharacterized protein n=1 Tax=Vreelandella boliviensis LC1 TaxID=1072583 RepID=A0A7U9C373_9GAMM|nr:hypothetical protein KUC_0710 [Halomonas boliviensis LC1]
MMLLLDEIMMNNYCRKSLGPKTPEAPAGLPTGASVLAAGNRVVCLLARR